MVKRHVSNPRHRLRPLPVVPLVVRRRYLIELPSPLPKVPLVVRRKVFSPLRHSSLRVLIRGAQANARPAVRAESLFFVADGGV